jgi:glycosyltransferase involved in cell wall biosynthesis
MFSVLMSVYAAERADFLREALESLHAQTLKARHVVLVRDGPVSGELSRVISEYQERLPIELIPLGENIGLARALNVGLAQIDSPWVIRFDTDDVCMPQRLALQSHVARSGGYDIFGGQVEEFDATPGDLGIVRRVPVDPVQIRSFARRRNPINHMTVCFRTALVKDLGGYPADIPLMEDYALWLRALAAGAIIGNSPETLVAARVGAGMYARRGGLRYIASELRLQRLCVELGIKTRPSAVLDGAVRMAGFALPETGRRLLYQAILRRDGCT